MQFTDIHCHILSGVDDGAADDEMMFEMLKRAHEDGARALCLTPHYEPETFGDNRELSEAAFARACAYAKENLPGLSLFLGNEISYRSGNFDDLRSGACRTMADGRYVLIDFLDWQNESIIFRALDNFLREGYLPIVAHVERYPCLKGRFRELERLYEQGVVYQVNAGSLMSESRRGPARQMAEKLIARGLADVIASDAHDLAGRAPGLSACYNMILSKFGTKTAEWLFAMAPSYILENKPIR